MAYVRIKFIDAYADVDATLPLTVGRKRTAVVVARELRPGDWVFITPRAYGEVLSVERTGPPPDRSQLVNR